MKIKNIKLKIMDTTSRVGLDIAKDIMNYVSRNYPDMDNISYIPIIFDYQCDNLMFVGMLVSRDGNVAENVILNIDGNMFCEIIKELEECGVNVENFAIKVIFYSNSMFSCEPVAITGLNKELNPFKFKWFETKNMN